MVNYKEIAIKLLETDQATLEALSECTYTFDDLLRKAIQIQDDKRDKLHYTDLLYAMYRMACEECNELIYNEIYHEINTEWIVLSDNLYLMEKLGKADSKMYEMEKERFWELHRVVDYLKNKQIDMLEAVEYDFNSIATNFYIRAELEELFREHFREALELFEKLTGWCIH